jgi:hypothetical protein
MLAMFVSLDAYEDLRHSGVQNTRYPIIPPCLRTIQVPASPITCLRW